MNSNLNVSEKDSENLIISFIENDNEYFTLKPEYKTELDLKVDNLVNYITNTSGKGKTDKECDQIYLSAQDLWRAIRDYLKDLEFNLNMNRPQLNYLMNLLSSRMEYGVDTIFYAIELKSMLKTFETESNFTNDVDLISFALNATEITYTYHLISNHRIKGLTKEAYLYAEILTRISGILGVANHYNELLKKLSVDIQNWVVTFDTGVNLETKTEVTSE